MNRAILIVICDFLVSAMLTMMIGMMPVHTGGTGVGLDKKTTELLLQELDSQNAELEALREKLRETVAKVGMTPEREAELRRLTERLAENKVRQEKLRESLRATKDNTGELSPEELQRRLDAERHELARMEIELQDSKRDLAASREQTGGVSARLQQTTAELNQTTAELQRTSGELRSELRTVRQQAAEQSQELAGERRRHDETRAKLDRVQSEHSEARVALARTEGELKSSRRKQQETSVEVKRLSNALAQSRGAGERLQREKASLQGKLSVQQQEHAAAKDKIVVLERQLLVERLKSAKAEGRVDVMRQTVKGLVPEVAANQKKAQDLMAKNAKIQAQLEVAQKLLSEKGRPVDQALKRFGESVVRIRCEVVEDGTLRDIVGKSDSLYPVVKFGNRTMLVGLLNRFAGDENVALSFRKISKLDYIVSSPLGGDKDLKRLAGPMYLLNDDMRVAGFTYRDKNCIPLDLMTADKLVRRGLRDLYLFKRTPGGLSAPLTGRASLSLNSGKRTLFIRNAGRANNELTAEPGDIVISAEGEFVGIAVAMDEIDKVRGVHVVLFEREEAWKNPKVVPLDKNPGEKYFSRFASVMRLIRNKIRPGYEQR